ncbi:phage tail tube protein [Lysinibacillus irui]|uniref:Phage tail tube protein n=1 Tax=Lysinibacillus irui TaxID=2998077 RepID=A0ABU5NJC8_9BACI|nr:phage tail tube protein [Lysinibacillus irui]MEA0553759.1 phage tail tube protein [Lysinibacillus irui]MEA0976143.1 phage tail tube protein [Lysinibacillus irui]MEA1042297.1 phage tail tube protein [Lysinibacillus irui]
MSTVKVLSRDIIVEINTGTDAVENFVEIKGLNSVTFSSAKSDADTTTFDEGGWGSHIVANRSRSASIAGFYLVDVETGERDPGQAAVEALNEAIGPASIGDFRMKFPGGEVKRFKASVNLAEVGGGNDDPMPWGAELTISGKVTTTVETGVQA